MAGPLSKLPRPAVVAVAVAAVAVAAVLFLAVIGITPFGSSPAPQVAAGQTPAIVEVPTAPPTSVPVVARTGTCAQAQSPLKAFMAAHPYSAVRASAPLSVQYSKLAAAALSSTACNAAQVAGFEDSYQFPWLSASVSQLPVRTVPLPSPPTS